MKKLIRPQHLKKGDKIAAVSLSWGGAGEPELRWRYEQGKKRLQEIFGLEVVEMSHTLSGDGYLRAHPEKRAEDLMAAFADKSVKGIFSCIGGDDTVRLLPYIDFDVIRENPKVFIGYSDTTANHFMMYKAGLASFYGAGILTDFAENVCMHDYTVEWINKTLFDNNPPGNIPASQEYVCQYLEWTEENKDIKRQTVPNTGYEVLQGKGKVTGHLIGGCIEVLEMIKGTELFPPLQDFDGAILFLETSECSPQPEYIKWWLMNYGAMGVLDRINGIIFGKPAFGKYYDEYKIEIKTILAEYGRADLPVMYNASFGHNEPKCCLPYGALAELDCDNKTFSVLEAGCV